MIKRITLYIIAILLVAGTAWAGITFDGVDDTATSSNFDLGLNGATELSIAFRVYVYSDTGGYSEPVIKYGADGVAPVGIAIVNQATGFGGEFFGYSLHSYEVDYGFTTPVSYNATHTLVFTWKRNNGTISDFGIYVDGSVQADAVINTDWCDYPTYYASYSASDGSHPMYLGDTPWGDAPHIILEEVAIWNIQLTQAEAQSFGSGTLATSIQSGNLKGYWRLNDGTVGTSADGDTLSDGSGNSHNLTGADGANNSGLTWTASLLGSTPVPVFLHHYEMLRRN